MSFTTTCNRCGSTDVSILDRGEYTECNNCGLNDWDFEYFPQWNPLGPLFIVKPATFTSLKPEFGQAEILLDDDGHYLSFKTIEEAKAWLKAKCIDIERVFIMSLVG